MSSSNSNLGEQLLDFVILDNSELQVRFTFIW